MKIAIHTETAIDWSEIHWDRAFGAAASARTRTYEQGDIRVRLVEYAPGYLADHWCSKGHIIYVLTGSLTIEHEDGQNSYELSVGMSWLAADHKGSPHRVRSDRGASVFIVD